MPHPPRLLTHAGETLPLTEWAARYRLDVETLRCRLDKLGWDAARALETPPDRRFARGGGRPARGSVRPAPEMKHHKPSGTARVRWTENGKERVKVLGRWGTNEARYQYRRFVAEWAAGSAGGPAHAITLREVLTMWLAWGEQEYRKAGAWTSEVHIDRAAVAPALELYGDTPAAEFTPARLRAVRAVLVSRGLAVVTVNKYLSRIVHGLGWAVGQSLVNPDVPAALERVERLKPGRVASADRKPKSDVPAGVVTTTLAALRDNGRGRLVRLAVELQRLTGMRPGEVCRLRPCDLDRSAEPWTYSVQAPKNLHRGERVRRYFFGPRARAVMSELLPDCPVNSPVLSYVRGDGIRIGLTPNRYGLAIRQACRRAGVHGWTPHQLRHTTATRVAEHAGSVAEAAAVIGDAARTAAGVYVHYSPAEEIRRRYAAEHG